MPYNGNSIFQIQIKENIKLMIRFNNDYNHGAHPEILEALGAINGNSYGGYGEDEWCEKAAELIREKIHCADAAVHFFRGRRRRILL